MSGSGSDSDSGAAKKVRKAPMTLINEDPNIGDSATAPVPESEDDQNHDSMKEDAREKDSKKNAPPQP